MNPTTRKRCMAYLLHLLWMIFFNIQLSIMRQLFSQTFRNVQWMIALIAPLLKEMNERIIDKLMHISSSQENHTEMKFVGKILMNIYYSLWLATSFSLLTPAIEYILLFMNDCFRIRCPYIQCLSSYYNFVLPFHHSNEPLSLGNL